MIYYFSFFLEMVLAMMFIVLFMLIERFIYFYDNQIDIKKKMREERERLLKEN